LSQLPITPFNLVCTNVPGPQHPLYLLGHKMLRWYPYVPIGGEMAVNCAILSYDGMMYFGFSGNVQAAPDLRRLEQFVKESFTELRAAAGMKKPRKQTVRKKTHTTKQARPLARRTKPTNGAVSGHNGGVSPNPSEALPSSGPEIADGEPNEGVLAGAETSGRAAGRRVAESV
jgi:hypothetical protein